MLRPALAFLTLCGVVFLLAPTVQSVHDGVTGLNIHRDLPWQIWRWGHLEPPPGISEPTCSPHNFDQEVNVTEWPAHIEKDQRFTLRGVDLSPAQSFIGISDIPIDIFLNASKDKPGTLLGHTTTRADGSFTLPATVPENLDAQHYHIVAHALRTPKGCSLLYYEAWSDPEMNVTARTSIRFDVPPRAVIGHNVTILGTLTDVTGAPVRSADVTLMIDGKKTLVHTDGSGEFRYVLTPTRGGNITFNATYAGTAFYGASNAASHVDILPEDVEFSETLDFVRGEARLLHGQVWLSPGATPGPVTFTFTGIRFATCDACPATSNVTVTPAADGTFALTLLVPHAEGHGPFHLTTSGGGLKSVVPFDGTARVPVTVTLDAHGNGLFHKTFGGTARALDDNGAPVPGALTVDTPTGWANGTSVVAFQGSAPCGMHRATALYEGGGDYMPGVQVREFGVCGFLAKLPPWMLGVPLWVWTLALLALAALGLVARRLFERYAPTISRGPPIEIRFVEPSDGASEVVGVGDTVIAEIALEDAPPTGHTVRAGTHRAMEAIELQGLSARVPIATSELGDIAVRAEILNEKGRVVTRRTAILHVVRYAEEIETRYRRLKAGKNVDDAVSPREFESWLRSNDPQVDPSVAQNLVGLFEEADYSPREAGRREFLAFLRAEKGVRRDAV